MGLRIFGLISLFSVLVVKSSCTEVVGVGVILDSSRDELWKISTSYMEMARSDFYQLLHPNYKTRLGFHFRDPKDNVVHAASAAVDLMENVEVEVIIGPTWSTQAKFVIELGRGAQVPIVSFSATSPSLLQTRNPYFVRTAYDDSAQVKAIVSIIQAFSWKEVTIIYEDTEYGNGLISYLTDAFQGVDIRVPYIRAISPSSPTLELDILTTLNTLLTNQTRVFLVHMTGALGLKLFAQAKEARMLTEDFAWIVTDGLSSLLEPMIAKAASTMEGVVGVRPYIPMASKLAFNQKMETLNETMDFNIYGLWAYDTVTAIATVVETAWTSSAWSNGSNRKAEPLNCMNFSSTRTSKIGHKILQGIQNFRIANGGLSGNFHLVNGQLQPSAFEVFNVVGNEEQVIGYWTSEYGLSKDIFGKGEEGYSTSKESLQAPIWPGKTRKVPNGWTILVKGETQMKIGVPLKEGFKEFFAIDWDSYTNEPNYSGFAFDVFSAMKEELDPLFPNYVFVPFVNERRRSNGTYSELLKQIDEKKVHAVVGDITITSDRAKTVDFTLPYSESGVIMLVSVKDNHSGDMWIFFKPLHWDLWLVTGLAFLVNGMVVWFLERHNSEDFRGSWHKKLELSIWFSFSTLVFAHREKIASNWTRTVVVVWVFMVLILTQSYAANLASLLTFQRLHPKYLSVEEIQSKGLPVGYQANSFVKDEILIGHLNFNEKYLIPYGSVDEYHIALSSGQVAAIFDEIPYIRLFLGKYCKKFMMYGPTYKSDGLGFAFPRNSPLVSSVSRAILAVSENMTKMEEINNKNKLSQNLCEDPPKSEESLRLHRFVGLFIIVGTISIFCLGGELIQSNWNLLLSNTSELCGRLSTLWTQVMEKWHRRAYTSRSTSRINSISDHDNIYAPNSSPC